MPLGVTVSSLQHSIDIYLKLNSASVPFLLSGGKLRQVAANALATALMYYPDRVHANESRSACSRLETVVKLYVGRDVDHSVALTQWAKLIRAKFRADNLSLNCEGDGGIQQVAEVISMLSNTVATQSSEIQALSSKLDLQGAKLDQLLALVAAIGSSPRAAGSSPAASSAVASTLGASPARASSSADPLSLFFRGLRALARATPSTVRALRAAGPFLRLWGYTLQRQAVSSRLVTSPNSRWTPFMSMSCRSREPCRPTSLPSRRTASDLSCCTLTPCPPTMKRCCWP